METYFTNHYEEQYDSDLTGEIEGLLGPAGAEAFFALRGQIDMIVEAEDVDLSSMPDQEDWSTSGFVKRSMELAELAVAQEKPAGQVAITLASAQREILADAMLRAQAIIADKADDDLRSREIAERMRCLAVLRSGARAAEEKVASGAEELVAKARSGGDGGYIEVNPDGTKVEAERGKAKKVKKTKDKAKDRKEEGPGKQEPIVTPTGLTIRIG